MRYFCISDDEDVLTGLRLAGIEGELCRDATEVDEAVSRVEKDGDIAVLIVTERCHTLCRERLDALKLSAERPLVNVISDSRGGGSISESITRLIQEAIGIRL